MKPNIVFYFSDQQRWDTLNPTVMPNLSKIAEDGVIFENSFTCQPVCGPARACLQTGMYATKNGSVINGVPLDTTIEPLAEKLKAVGYKTAYIGKWHLASDLIEGQGCHCEKDAVPKEKQGGYDYWRAADVLEFTSHGYDGYVFDGDGNKIDFKGYRADCINDFALEYLDKEADGEQPFFLFVSQLEPHHQNDRGRYEGKKEYLEKFKDAPIPGDLSFLKGDYRENYPDYLAAIAALDENVGRLAEKLKEKGLYENTVLIYTSDHGSHFKTRNAEYKRSCHDASIHTPLMIAGDVFKGGKRDKRLVSLIDLPATVLDLAGAEIPDCYDGISVKAQFEKRKRGRPACFIQISETQIGRAFRTERYTYSIKRGGMAKSYAQYVATKKNESNYYFEDYLYDNEKDPYQTKNLIKDPAYAGHRSDSHIMMAYLMEQAGEKPPKILKALRVKKK